MGIIFVWEHILGKKTSARACAMAPGLCRLERKEKEERVGSRDKRRYSIQLASPQEGGSYQ